MSADRCPTCGAEMTERSAVSLGAWYMHDNHTFTRLVGTPRQMASAAVEIARTSPYGMLCPVRLLDQRGRVVRAVGTCVHMHGPDSVSVFAGETDAWIAALEADADVARLAQSFLP